MTSCGHAMHVKCYQNFFDNLVRSERTRLTQSLIRNILNYDVNKTEFLCPMCERLSNIALPVTGSIGAHFALADANSQSFFNWAERMKKTAKNKALEGNPADYESESALPRTVPKQPSAGHSKNIGQKLVLKCPPPPQKIALAEETADIFATFSMNLLGKSVTNAQTGSKDYRLVQMPFQAAALSLHISQARACKNGKDALVENDREADQLRFLIR